MAQTLTVTKTTRGGFRQFQSAFSEVWTVKGTVTDSDSVAATAIGEFDVTVAGVAFGDMVLGLSFGADFDDGTDQAMPSAHVSAADTVTVQWMADDGAFAADALNGVVFRFLVGRPAW